MNLFILLFLVPGYLYTQWSLNQVYESQQRTGHEQYFNIAFWSLILFLISSLVIFGLDLVVLSGCTSIWDHVHKWITSQIRLRVGSLSGADSSDAEVYAFCTANLLISLLYVSFLRWRARRKPLEDRVRALRKAVQENDLELLLLDSYEYEFPVSVTLKNGKVYIGQVTRVAFERVEKKYFTLLPYLSGYRDPNSKRLTITTNYKSVYTRLGSIEDCDVSPEDFAMIFPRDRIQTANRFSLSVYASMKDPKNF